MTKAPKLEIQRINVSAQGYDKSGAYWGAGPDVFIATDGAEEVTVRAGSVAEARRKVAAELSRKPGTPPPSEPLGGNSPRKTRYEFDWTNPASGGVIKIRITHARDYLASGMDHIEVESVKPKRAVLPVTETGYRSHFMPALDLINAGGAVAFVRAWLDREAAGKQWQRQTTARSQGDLFQWADAQGEVGKRKAKRAPSAPRAGRQSKAKWGRAPE
jgi:hypothetical protein